MDAGTAKAKQWQMTSCTVYFILPRRYKAFLFDENLSKNQFLLNNVINTSVKYFFEIEISEPLKKRKRFVAIRSAKRDRKVRFFVVFPEIWKAMSGASVRWNAFRVCVVWTALFVNRGAFGDIAPPIVFVHPSFVVPKNICFKHVIWTKILLP